MLLPILSEIADKVGIVCHSELAIKDINRGWLLPIGNGQAKSVTELDWKAGFSFFALNGNERLTELDSGRARSILLQSVRPLSLFVVIRPEDVGADDSFSAERITQSLKTKIGANNLPISRVRLNAGMVKSSVISVQYGTAVWNELGINGEARLNLIAARFDFEVTIAGNQECFSNWVCEDGVVPAPPPPPFCADAGYVLEDTNGGVISSGAIPSGGTGNIVAPNGVVSVEDSVGNVLHTVSVESAGSAVQPLADSSVTVFNSLGAVVDSGSVLAEGSGTFSAPDAAIDVNGDSSFGSVASGGSLNIGVENTNGAFIGAFDNNTNSWVIGDSAVANSDNSYQVSLPATDSLALPDQSIEVNNVVEGSIPSVGTIDINLSDGTNVITPTSVAVTGRVVDIELPGGLVMAVDFVADKLVANTGETITFTDLTNNSPTEWAWDFNGVGYSRLQNPTFSFSTLGFKNITLFAAKTGLGGFNTKTNYIEIIDADVTAFLLATGINDPIIEGAITNLVLDLKTAGIWTKMKAIYPFVGGTATTHKYNLKDPQDTNAAFRLSFSGGWTHSANGALPNGTNAFADTFLVPNTSLLLNSTHISGYVRNNVGVNAPILSSENAATFNNGLYIWPRLTNDYSVRINDDASATGAASDSRGFHLAIRTASNVKKYFRNNLSVFSLTTASTALNSSSIYIGASRNNANFSTHQTAFNSIGDGLTDPEATAFYTAVQTFQTALSRQV
jgi:PKD repeat protein